MSTVAPNNFPHASAGFLYDRAQHRVLLHLRDGNTKYSPNQWAFFTGLSEDGETSVQTFCRELKEEIGLTIVPSDAKFLREYLNEERNTYRHVFFVERAVPLSRLVLGEGAGMDWVPLERVFDLPLTEKTASDLRYFLEHLP